MSNLLPLTLIILNLCIVILLIGLVFVYYNLNQKYLKILKEDNTDSKQALRKARQKARKIIEDAIIQSQTIVKETSESAQKIITQTTVFSEEQKAQMTREITIIAQNQSQNFNNLINEVKNESINILNNISNSAKQDAQKQLEELKLKMLTEVADLESFLKLKADSQLAKLGQDLENYKKERIKVLDENMVTIVSEVSKEVVGKVISPEEHTEIVLKALEDAKRRNII